jgi:hypothetical protein
LKAIFPIPEITEVCMKSIGKIAFKYYLLFQHHSVPDETETDEPSWLLGAHPGPYKAIFPIPEITEVCMKSSW